MFFSRGRAVVFFALSISCTLFSKNGVSLDFIGSSMLSLRESNMKDQKPVDTPDSIVISEKVPKLFKNMVPLELEIEEPKVDPIVFQNSNTSRALQCYESLPQYILIRGILTEYSYFLTLYYRLKCEHNHEYHDGTKCGDTLFLIDLLENKAELIRERFLKKKNHCFTLEVNAVSVQSRYYDSDGFVGRADDVLNDKELLMLERSFLRRVIAQFETILTNKTIEYELSCMRNNDSGSNVDCYLLRTECWLLETELVSISEEYFKRLSRFQRMKDDLA
ncbi:putative signal peptide-containing secreted protein [Cryptosporidium canis]|nr:putative signal peptide-containing secreted protein [Cryptosporidium canis]